MTTGKWIQIHRSNKNILHYECRSRSLVASVEYWQEEKIGEITIRISRKVFEKELDDVTLNDCFERLDREIRNYSDWFRELAEIPWDF
jgi:hypothetical protein